MTTLPRRISNGQSGFNVTPEDNTISKSLKADGKQSHDNLKNLSGSEFDKAYIDQQVILHEKALATLNETLLPNVTDETLKSHLEKTRTAVTEHLNDARSIQTKIQ